MIAITPNPTTYDADRVRSVKEKLLRAFVAWQATPNHEHLFPPKQMMPLATWGDESFSDVRTSALLGQLAHYSGGKFIHVNESTRRQSAATVLFTDDQTDPIVVDAGWLTTLRCALMAIIVAERFIDISQETVFGFAGMGRINLETARLLNMLHGVRRFVVRGSRQNRTRNLGALAGLLPDCHVVSDTTPTMLGLASASAIISCTTNNYADDMAQYDWLRDVPLFIAQDGGYWLDESFRRHLPVLSDYPAQHEAHWPDEFPWDATKPEFVPLIDAAVGRQAAVYLFGIGLADMVVAMDAWEHAR